MFVGNSLPSLTNTQARCTIVTHTAAKFTLGPEVLLTEAHLGKNEGGAEGGRREGWEGGLLQGT